MKMVIALFLICVGLGVDANGSENLEIALGLSFFFGAINLIQPAMSGLHLISNALFPKKSRSK